MARQATNELLQKAKKSKSDEFYTQLCDIERELIHYPDSFRAKVVYCNCDDAFASRFVRDRIYVCAGFSLGRNGLCRSRFVNGRFGPSFSDADRCNRGNCDSCHCQRNRDPFSVIISKKESVRKTIRIYYIWKG